MSTCLSHPCPNQITTPSTRIAFSRILRDGVWEVVRNFRSAHSRKARTLAREQSNLLGSEFGMWKRQNPMPVVAIPCLRTNTRTSCSLIMTILIIGNMDARNPPFWIAWREMLAKLIAWASQWVGIWTDRDPQYSCIGGKAPSIPAGYKAGEDCVWEYEILGLMSKGREMWRIHSNLVTLGIIGLSVVIVLILAIAVLKCVQNKQNMVVRNMNNSLIEPPNSMSV